MEKQVPLQIKFWNAMIAALAAVPILGTTIGAAAAQD